MESFPLMAEPLVKEKMKNEKFYSGLFIGVIGKDLILTVHFIVIRSKLLYYRLLSCITFSL